MLQKVLRADYIMPVSNQTTTENGFNLDSVEAGEYDSPLEINGFEISNVNGEKLVVAEKHASLGELSFNNVTEGDSCKVEFAVDKSSKIILVCGMNGADGRVTVSGTLANGEGYNNARFVEPYGGDTLYVAREEAFVLEEGTYSFTFSGIDINGMKVSQV